MRVSGEEISSETTRLIELGFHCLGDLEQREMGFLGG